MKQLLQEVDSLGGDPSDPVWRWLILNGPHGPSFTWSQTRKAPPGYVGVEHLERVVSEFSESDPCFPSRARRVVGLALGSPAVILLCRAIQVAAVVGGAEELRLIARFESHESNLVSGQAKAACFYLRRRLRRRSGL